MIGIAELRQMKSGRPRGGAQKGERKGSKRYVELEDGSIIKWWNGEWRFFSTRWNSRVATSLNTRAMTVAVENGRLVKDEERFSNFDDFARRLVKVVGLDQLIRIVQWIQS